MSGTGAAPRGEPKKDMRPRVVRDLKKGFTGVLWLYSNARSYLVGINLTKGGGNNRKVKARGLNDNFDNETALWNLFSSEGSSKRKTLQGLP
jgi:hypothetical protein